MQRIAVRIAWTLLTTSLIAAWAWACPGKDAAISTSAACATKSAKATTNHRAVAKQSAKPVKQSSKKLAAKTAAKTAAGAASMRIFRDPETGEVGPPTAENLRLMNRDNPVVEVDRTTLPQINLGDGRGYMIATDQIQDAVVVKLDRNGRRVFTCTQDPQAALKAPATPAREDR